MTSFTASLGTWTYRVSPGLASVGLKVILFTVRSAFMAPRTFSECEGSRLGGTAMVYNVFSKLICILVMAEGGYDPTTENETPWEDHGIDHDDDDDDDDDDDTTGPGTPGAASTPYRPGVRYHPDEEHEMSTLPTEDSGLVHSPGEPAWNALTHLYPDVNATELEAFIDPKTQRLKIKMTGQGKASYFLYTTEKSSNTQQLNPKLSMEIRRALGESTLDQASVLQQERERNLREIVEKNEQKKATGGGGRSGSARASTRPGQPS